VVQVKLAPAHAVWFRLAWEVRFALSNQIFNVRASRFGDVSPNCCAPACRSVRQQVENMMKKIIMVRTCISLSSMQFRGCCHSRVVQGFAAREQ
jgi:hypothetical protein